MDKKLKEKLKKHFEFIYPDKDANKIISKVEKLANKYETKQTGSSWISEKDAMLITYGDSIVEEGKPGLEALNEFLTKYVNDAISAVHILPMFPYTSDDGFSVVDYKKINPDLGEWKDVENLSKNYKLMFDAVVNHISKSSDWFQKYLKQEKPYDEYFLTCDPNADYSKVTRPRALPLLTKFETAKGEKYVWTTFSEDQIDLNFKSVDVYLEVLDVLLTYASRGARFIRLDAIGFLWKELGTTCMHHPKTHEIIKSYRAILDEYMPGTLIITETNVPHEENISYFGNGDDEAQLVYQFPLPPLTMFSILTGNAEKLSKWADSLDEPKQGTTYFNFLSSHDGIGVRPVEGILNEEEKKVLLDNTLKNGGVISYKNNSDGSKSPYELNINYQDALASPDESDEIRINKFLAAETILLSMQGLPGIYVHSLIGSRNDYYGKETSGIPRRINREKININYLEKELNNSTNRKKIFDEILRRLKIRGEHKEFAPDSKQKILSLDKRVFALERISKNKKITVLVNVSSDEVQLDIENKGLDIISEIYVDKKVNLNPLQCMWILKED